MRKTGNRQLFKRIPIYHRNASEPVACSLQPSFLSLTFYMKFYFVILCFLFCFSCKVRHEKGFSGSFGEPSTTVSYTAAKEPLRDSIVYAGKQVETIGTLPAANNHRSGAAVSPGHKTTARTAAHNKALQQFLKAHTPDKSLRSPAVWLWSALIVLVAIVLIALAVEFGFVLAASQLMYFVLVVGSLVLGIVGGGLALFFLWLKYFRDRAKNPPPPKVKKEGTSDYAGWLALFFSAVGVFMLIFIAATPYFNLTPVIGNSAMLMLIVGFVLALRVRYLNRNKESYAGRIAAVVALILGILLLLAIAFVVVVTLLNI
jgi:hypothetical protein